MHLQSLTLTDFRSCASTRVRFDETLTVLAGENNAGKTNVLDALRLVAAPSEARRSRYLTAEDVRIDAAQLRLEVEFAGLDPAQRGLFVSALRSNGASEALWQMSWAPPTG